MDKSDYFTAIILNLLRNQTFSQPTTVFVALSADAGAIVAGSSGQLPGELASGTNGYNRKAIAFNVPSGDTMDATEVLFDIVTGSNWGNINQFAIVDSATQAGSEMFYFDAVTTPLQVDVGETARFQAGQLTVQET